MSLRTKLILSQVAIILITTGLVAYFAYHRRSAEILEDMRELVRRTAGTAALQIQGDDLAAIKTPEDEMTEEFARVEEILNKVRLVNGLAENEIYVLRPVEGLFDTEFVVMVETPRYIGNRYLISAGNEEPFEAAVKSGTPSYTDVYEDAHGTWISGYGPIFDSTGAVVAVLEVDSEIGRFMKRKEAELITLAATAGGMTLLGGFLAAILTSPLVSVVRKLTTGFRQIMGGTFPQINDVKRKDEMGKLVDGFNSMSYSLHLSQYQLQEAMRSLNSVAEKAPTMFLSQDRRLVALLVLENIATRESFKEASVVCTYTAEAGSEEEPTVVRHSSAKPGTLKRSHELPVEINGQRYGTIVIESPEDTLYPVDLDIARTWANFFAAILATKERTEQAGREARSEAVDTATGRFLTEIREIERSLGQENIGGGTPGPEAPNIRRAAKRIELVKRDLSLIGRSAEAEPSNSRPVGAMLQELVEDFKRMHPNGMPVAAQDLTSTSDAVPDAKKLRAVLLSLLAYCDRAQRANPPAYPPSAEVTAKSSGDVLRILLQSNAPALSPEASEKLMRSGDTLSVYDENILPVPMTRLVLESIGGSIEYQPGLEFGGLFVLRIPLMKAVG